MMGSIFFCLDGRAKKESTALFPTNRNMECSICRLVVSASQMRDGEMEMDRI
mgnify:FL=1